MKRRKTSAPAFVALSVVLTLSGPAWAQPRQTPSGYAVPRYLTLKFSKVNARSGPGDDHRLLFVYRAKGLPVQVIAETREWRRVCDPEGQVAWVHKRVTTGQRGVINTGRRPAALLRQPRSDAPAAAFLDIRAMAELDRCEKGWCRIKAGRTKGWVREGTLWGTGARLQCR